jgi:hypothetical protein
VWRRACKINIEKHDDARLHSTLNIQKYLMHDAKYS